MTSTTLSTEEETSLYDWHLQQRLLHEAGELEMFKVSVLDESFPNWFFPVTDEDASHAMHSDAAELNNAFTMWWNAVIKPRNADTFREIRAKAVADGFGIPAWAL